MGICQSPGSSVRLPFVLLKINWVEKHDLQTWVKKSLFPLRIWFTSLYWRGCDQQCWFLVFYEVSQVWSRKRFPMLKWSSTNEDSSRFCKSWNMTKNKPKKDTFPSQTPVLSNNAVRCSNFCFDLCPYCKKYGQCYTTQWNTRLLVTWNRTTLLGALLTCSSTISCLPEGVTSSPTIIYPKS